MTGERYIALRVAPDIQQEQPEWMAAAVCASVDPELFFPEKGGSPREAKKICAGCPVKQECLDFALELDERFGVYGGMSERDRRRLKKRTPRARTGQIRHGTPAGYRAHYRLSRPPCQACRDAYAVYKGERRDARRKGAA